MRVPFVDLAAEHVQLGDQLAQAFRRVLVSGRYVLGPEVEHFEQALASHTGAAAAVGVSSGTDALLCALLALGIGPGDEVITTPFTFVSTAEAIARVGASPRFVDIDPTSLNIDPAAVRRALTERTRAILAVHLFGRAADLGALGRIADEAGRFLIEDAAQALGATWQGRLVGAQGTIGCFSFFPTKVLGALGDAGAIVCNDAELADRCRRLRQHGAADPDRYTELGGNFRLDALQAALLDVKLAELDAWIGARRSHARAYRERLGDCSLLELPCEDPGAVWSVYAVRVRNGARDRLAQHLRERGVETKTYYRVPLHLQPLFAPCEALLPEAERAARELLCLPIHPTLSEEQREHVVACIRELE